MFFPQIVNRPDARKYSIMARKNIHEECFHIYPSHSLVSLLAYSGINSLISSAHCLRISFLSQKVTP